MNFKNTEVLCSTVVAGSLASPVTLLTGELALRWNHSWMLGLRHDRLATFHCVLCKSTHIANVIIHECRCCHGIIWFWWSQSQKNCYLPLLLGYSRSHLLKVNLQSQMGMYILVSGIEPNANSTLWNRKDNTRQETWGFDDTGRYDAGNLRIWWYR